MYTKKNFKNIVSFLSIFIFIVTIVFPIIIKSQTAGAQYWTALPPYNTLWPLWSPVLSPVDDVTGLPTPLVTSLYPSTVLPVQPALTWQPNLRNPWLLYNTPLGLAYYDLIGGVNLWPPDILINQITGLPITITLPPNYATLPPTPPWWILTNIPAANNDYGVAYYNFYLASTLLQTATSTLFTPTPPPVLPAYALTINPVLP